MYIQSCTKGCAAHFLCTVCKSNIQETSQRKLLTKLSLTIYKMHNSLIIRKDFITYRIREDLYLSIHMTLNKVPKNILFFLFLQKNIGCGYSLEVPHQRVPHSLCFQGEIRKVVCEYHPPPHLCTPPPPPPTPLLSELCIQADDSLLHLLIQKNSSSVIKQWNKFYFRCMDTLQGRSLSSKYLPPFSKGAKMKELTPHINNKYFSFKSSQLRKDSCKNSFLDTSVSRRTKYLLW